MLHALPNKMQGTELDLHCCSEYCTVGVDDVQWLLHMPVDITSRLSHSADRP